MPRLRDVAGRLSASGGQAAFPASSLFWGNSMFRLSRAPRALACLLSIPAVTASMPASAGLLDLLKPPAVSITASTASVTEGGQVTVTVKLSQASLRNVEVPLTLGGTATKGRDYRNDIPASLSFGVLETTRQFTLTTIDDKEIEPLETLTIALGTPKNATLGTPGSLSLAIADNDAPALPTLICPGKPSAAISAANTAAWVMSEIDRDSHRRPGLSADDLAFSRSSEVLISTWSIPRRHLRSEGPACAAVTGAACAVMTSAPTSMAREACSTLWTWQISGTPAARIRAA